MADDGSLDELDELARLLQTGEPGAADLLRRYIPQLDLDAAKMPEEPQIPPTGNTRGLMSPWSDGLALVARDTGIFAIGSTVRPSLRVDGASVDLAPLAGTSYWTGLAKLAPGVTHAYEFMVAGRSLGIGDVAGYYSSSWPTEGVARGTLTGPLIVESANVYPRATTEYWIYATAGVDPTVPAPLMIWLDGASYVGARDVSNLRLQVVTDNLAASGDIPPIVHVLVSASSAGDLPPKQYPDQDPRSLMRSVQFDTASDRYGRHLLDEVLPDVAKHYALREDGYSRAVAGGSSGGVASFTLAWFHNEHFTRVNSWIGSFTGLQWAPGQSEPGGQDYATLVRREHRNMRIWMSDGAHDINVDANGRPDIAGAGSWPINNIQLANSLKVFGYDMHFEFGTAGHNMAQPSLDLPALLRWLWRDYDPACTAKQFEQDAAERARAAWTISVSRA